MKAAEGDAVRQSQYSRQIKELEDFFRVKLVERQGKVIRLTPTGKELARISRYFMRGLSNFQRGCLAEEQAFHIGGSATVVRHFLLPVLCNSSPQSERATYTTEVVDDDEIERRLQDLTLDFGIVANASLSRPLQNQQLAKWKLALYVPKALRLTEAQCVRAYGENRLPTAVGRKEMSRLNVLLPAEHQAQLTCDSFLEAKAALESKKFAALLPSFLVSSSIPRSFIRVEVPEIDSRAFHFYLAWNPRLLRLNPHAIKTRDRLIEQLSAGGRISRGQ